MARATRTTEQRERRRIETSGVPRRGDRSSELELLMARRLGLAPPAKADYLPQPERFCPPEIRLGNEDLPVFEYRDAIVQSVKDNPITICLAETGSGKSTQVPQFLFEEGFEVVLTQPRRLAAEMLSRRIGEEISQHLGLDGYRYVGYQTAERSNITDQTRIMVVTDGLQLVKELGVFEQNMQHNPDTPHVLMIDEVHERNKNIDVLIGWVNKNVSEHSNLRVVFTTAGINAERLSRHFANTGFIPPIIEVPGRSHPIESSEEPTSTVVEQAVKQARDGKNVLIFLPGLTEIKDTMSAVQKILSGDKRKDYVLLPLHGKLSPQEQRAVETHYPGPKIIFATNIAETSITIPDIDTVVDSGLERRVEIDEEGVESLRIAPTSQASCKQRMGRCGRTHEGTYILTRLSEKVDHVPFLNRPEYSTPEILRSNIDRNVLAIAAAGLDISDLRLLDSLDSRDIARSKEALRILGAFDDQNEITTRGRRMNRFPVRPSFSRMITYAEEHNYTAKMKSYVAAMVAAMESGGMPDYTSHSKGWRKLTGESTSDPLAQLDLYLRTMDIEDPRELAEHDLNVRSVQRARELHYKLVRRMGVQPGRIDQFLNGEQRDLLKDCVVAGMVDFVYEKAGAKEYVRTTRRMGKEATLRCLSDRSVVRGTPSIVVGTPYAIDPPLGTRLLERHIVQDATATTLRQLGEVAAEHCAWENDNHPYIWRDDVPYIRQQRVFRGSVPVGEYREDRAPWSKELARTIVSLSLQHPRRFLREILTMKKLSERLHHLSGTTPPITNDVVVERINQLAGINRGYSKIMSPGMLDAELATHVDEFRSLLPSEEEQEAIMLGSPDHVEFEGISLQIAYRSGIPHIARITDEVKRDLCTTSGNLRLSDGRDILVPHKVGRNSKRYTIEDFRRIYQREV